MLTCRSPISFASYSCTSHACDQTDSCNLIHRINSATEFCQWNWTSHIHPERERRISQKLQRQKYTPIFDEFKPIFFASPHFDTHNTRPFLSNEKQFFPTKNFLNECMHLRCFWSAQPTIEIKFFNRHLNLWKICFEHYVVRSTVCFQLNNLTFRLSFVFIEVFWGRNSGKSQRFYVFPRAFPFNSISFLTLCCLSGCFSPYDCLSFSFFISVSLFLSLSRFLSIFLSHFSISQFFSHKRIQKKKSLSKWINLLCLPSQYRCW